MFDILKSVSLSPETILWNIIYVLWTPSDQRFTDLFKIDVLKESRQNFKITFKTTSCDQKLLSFKP